MIERLEIVGKIAHWRTLQISLIHELNCHLVRVSPDVASSEMIHKTEEC